MVLNISCNLSNTVRKVENRMTVWVQRVLSVLVVNPLIASLAGSWGSLPLAASVHHHEEVLYPVSLAGGKDKNLKFEK